MSCDLKKAFPNVPEEFHNKVIESCRLLSENKEMEKMKLNRRFTWKKTAACVAIATLVIGTSTYAAGKLSGYIGCTTKQNVYKEAPSQEKVEKDYGITAKIPESFSNGYTFVTVNEGKVSSVDEAGNKLETVKQLDVDYKNGNDTVTLYISKEMYGSEEDATTKATKTVNDINLYYSSYINKIVPVGYEMTEQDKKDEESGKYVFSYGGSDEGVSTTVVKSVRWVEDGIEYDILGMDSVLTKEEMCEMAKEMIEQ